MERQPVVKTLFTFANPKKLNLRPSFQRKFVWKINQMVALVDSIYRGFDITPIYVWKNDPSNSNGKESIIDGQQRLTTMIKFFNNEFALKKNKCPGLPEQLHGKKFSELSDEDQERIREYNLDVIEVRGELHEIEEMFMRMQGGTKLKAAEVRNAKGGDIRDFVHTVAPMKYFDVFNISRNLSQDLEAVHRILVLEMKDLQPSNLRSQDVNKGYLSLIKEGVSDEIKSRIINTLAYLSQDAPKLENKDKIKKVNIIPLYIMARKHMENVDGIEFWKWATSFFTDRYPEAYKEASKESTSDRDSLTIRLDILQVDFDEYFKKVGKGA